MADARLRELERRSAQGDPAARRDLLRERLRAGELSREHLELAAYLGDPNARALSREPEPPTNEGEWLVGFGRFGHETLVRAITVAARVALGGWESWGAGEFAPGSAIRAALESVVRGDDVLESTDALGHAQAVLDDASQLLGALEAEHGLNLESAWQAHRAGLATLAAARALEGVAGDHPAPTEWAAELAASVDPALLRTAIRDVLLGPLPLSP